MLLYVFGQVNFLPIGLGVGGLYFSSRIITLLRLRTSQISTSFEAHSFFDRGRLRITTLILGTDDIGGGPIFKLVEFLLLIENIFCEKFEI